MPRNLRLGDPFAGSYRNKWRASASILLASPGYFILRELGFYLTPELGGVSGHTFGVPHYAILLYKFNTEVMPIFVKIKLVFPVVDILSELTYKGLLASSLAKTIICLGQICMRLSLRCQNFGV